MENSQLRSFLAVAEEESVSRAATKLHLTQPAVTKQIQALERELKTVLFDRTSRGVALTATGRVLRDYARRSLALLAECQQFIHDTEDGTTGQLVVGAGTTTCIFELPRWLGELGVKLPGIDVVVRTGESREIIQYVLEREIDLGFVTSPVQHPELVTAELFSEEIVLVTAPTSLMHTNTSDRGRTLSLADYPLILFPRSSGFREYLDQMVATAGMAMHVKMETDSLEAIKSFVTTGLGASFLPARTVQSELASGILQRVQVKGLPLLQRQTSVIRRVDRHLGIGAKTLMAILQTPS